MTMSKESINEELLRALEEVPASVEEVSALLKKGADPVSAVRGGRSVLYWAAEDQPCEILKLLLDRSDFDVNYKSDEEYAPEPLIYRAARNIDFRVLPLLINEYGVECPIGGNYNPIHWVCVNYAARLRNRNKKKYNPFKATEDFYLYLRDECHIDDQNIFWNAVRGECLDLCKYMTTEKEIDLELENDEGKAAIHLAAETNGYTDILKWLVFEEHISPETESSFGMRPIHFASMGLPHESVLSFLVNDCKVDTTAQSDEGFCPIHYACNYGWEWVLEMFIEKLHFDYTLEDSDGWIPLDYTIYNKNVDSTKYLVKKYGKEGIRIAYERALSFNDLGYVQFLSEDCGFDLKKEKWVELYQYEDEEREWEDTPMMRVLRNDNLDIFRYCFEKHYGSKLPLLSKVPFERARGCWAE